jgi:hypothetical protein
LSSFNPTDTIVLEVVHSQDPTANVLTVYQDSIVVEIKDESGFTKIAKLNRHNPRLRSAQWVDSWFDISAWRGQTIKVSLHAYSAQGNAMGIDLIKVSAMNPLSVKQEVVVTEPSLYPNPSRELVTVNLPVGPSYHTLQLLSLNGQVLRHQDASQTTINTADLPAGLYVFRAIGKAGVFTTKLVKE